ncbi:MAG: TolC family protein, partial [Phycisphaerae bacterium]
APGIQPRSQRDTGTDFIIGPSLGLELPIFDQNQAQIARASYAYEQAVKTLDALSRELTQAIRGAVDQSATAWRLVAVYRDRSLPLARTNLDLSSEAYKAGRASFLSVLEAQRFFLDSRGKYVEAVERAAVTMATLEQTAGLPLSELVKNARSAPGPEPETSDGGQP